MLRVQISDRGAVSEDELARRLAGPGLTLLVRDRDLPREARALLAERLARLARAHKNSLWIAADFARGDTSSRRFPAGEASSQWELAIALGADGVHWPSDTEASTIAASTAHFSSVSVACHTLDDVTRACAAGATVVLLSPIFASPGKGAPLGVGALREARARIDAQGRAVKLVALGGVTAENLADCAACGADGGAAIRADLSRQ